MGLVWRESSYSHSDNCVEVAKPPDGSTAVRNSTHPDAGTVYFRPDEWDAFLGGVKAGELDDHAS